MSKFYTNLFHFTELYQVCSLTTDSISDIQDCFKRDKTRNATFFFCLPSCKIGNNTFLKTPIFGQKCLISANLNTVSANLNNNSADNKNHLTYLYDF